MNTKKSVVKNHPRSAKNEVFCKNTEESLVKTTREAQNFEVLWGSGAVARSILLEILGNPEVKKVLF